MKFTIYICQGDSGINVMQFQASYEPPEYTMEGTTPEHAVQAIQDRWPWYQGELFLAKYPGGERIVAVRVGQDGIARRESIGK